MEGWARYWQDRAVEALKAYRKMDAGAEALNLGIVVRIREDTLGPRIYWVKFQGKARYRMGGDKFTPTEQIRMSGKYKYSDRIFARFPDAIRRELLLCEANFAWIRYRTDRLAQLRNLCRAHTGTYQLRANID
ncbi:hypothetical protein BVG79_p2000011 (plasmid) [Ketogulonicigenium robustum]|uniref:Uncharacterized protein n=1 Tax=Ketogulonicigenium robustum TaxID=92947 RepID=A0A1W6P3V3_9RHOB|nr:hypothetical protein BVG79_p2000011 [Ketogulonicigenium robustum]